MVAWMPTTTASAATLVVSGGQLLGASDVDVNGTLYDVEFLDGTCVALFGGCDEVSDFTFHTEYDARDASRALLNEVFIDGVEGPFDTRAELTFGCNDTTMCNAVTPYGLVVRNTIMVFRAVNHNTETQDLITANTTGKKLDYATYSSSVYAVWTVVPEPGTGLLVGLGLVALCARGRRVH
jgi:hypothetical protein